MEAAGDEEASDLLVWLRLVPFKVWILVEIEDDVTEKLYVYDRLM